MYLRLFTSQTISVFLLGLLCFSMAANAAENDEGQSGVGFSAKQWFISGGGTYYGGPDDSAADDGFGPALAIGYGFNDKWAAELLFSSYDVDNDSPLSLKSRYNFVSVNVLRSFGASENWQPFVLLGGGVTDEIDGTNFNEFSDTQANVGVGIFRKLTERFSIRGDVRANYSFEYSSVQPFAYLALSVKLGSLSSSKIAAVKIADSDKDGVVDTEDQCPDSAAGAQVDATGCVQAKDDDGDGVINSTDNCPDTNAGAKVDEHGCYMALKKDITTYLDVAFKSNSSTISTLDQTEVKQVADFMRAYPSAYAVIEGHTDNTGTAEYNLQLSQKRAEAAQDYLINHAGISAERLSAKGFGESMPIGDNNTAEGRLLNRRVSVVIKSTEDVKSEN